MIVWISQGKFRKNMHLSKSLMGAWWLILLRRRKFSFCVFVSSVEDKQSAANCRSPSSGTSVFSSFSPPYLGEERGRGEGSRKRGWEKKELMTWWAVGSLVHYTGCFTFIRISPDYITLNIRGKEVNPQWCKIVVLVVRQESFDSILS